MSIFGDLVKQRLEKTASPKSPFGADVYPAKAWANTSTTGDLGRLKIRGDGSTNNPEIGSVDHGAMLYVVGGSVNGWVPVDVSQSRNASRSGENGGTVDGSWNNPSGWAYGTYLSATPLAIASSPVPVIATPAAPVVGASIASPGAMLPQGSSLKTALTIGFVALAGGAIAHEAKKNGVWDKLKRKFA